MTRVSRMPPRASLVILRQKPTPKVFVFIPAHDLTLRYTRRDGGFTVFPDFHVPDTCWEWDAVTGESKIRIVESLEDGKIMLRMFRLANVHESEDICWGGEYPPWEIDQRVIAFWESNFNDHLSGYLYDEPSMQEFLNSDEWVNNPGREEWETLNLKYERIAQMGVSVDEPYPSIRIAREKYRRVRDYARSKIRELETLLGAYYEGNPDPHGLVYALERQFTEEKAHRIGCIRSAISRLAASIEWARDRCRDIEDRRDRLIYAADSRHSFRWRYHHGWTAAVAMSRENLQHGDEDFTPEDLDWYRRRLLVSRRTQLLNRRNRLHTECYETWNNARRARMKDQWWKGDWLKAGEVRDYTQYIYGTERQMYQGIWGVGLCDQSDRIPGLPRETWDHYNYKFLFPVWEGNQKGALCAMLSEIPYLGNEWSSGNFNFRPLNPSTEKDLYTEIEEVFA